MSDASLFLSFVLPGLLLVCVFVLPRLSRWLDRVANRSERRTELIEDYHRNAMVFLKETDASKDGRTRDVVIFLGDAMMNGTKLIRTMLFAPREKLPAKKDALLRSEFESLSPKAQEALGKALGASLLVSSSQSIFLGGFYRSALMLVMTDNLRQVREPEQIIHRFPRTEKLWSGSESLPC